MLASQTDRPAIVPAAPSSQLDHQRLASEVLRACVLGDAPAVRELLHQSAPVALPALFAAVQGGHAEVVELLAASPDVDVNRCLANGCSPLFKAVSLGHTGCAARLLDAQAAVNAPSNGSSPLLVAAAQGHAAVRLTGPFLTLARTPRSRTPTRTPTHTSLEGPLTSTPRPHPCPDQAVELLLAHGAAPDGPTPDGTTPLIAACTPSSSEEEARAQSPGGRATSRRPLPAESGAIPRLLLRARARVCLADGAMTKSGWAVFGLAHRSDDDELMTLLEQSCAEQRGAWQEEGGAGQSDSGAALCDPSPRAPTAAGGGAAAEASAAARGATAPCSAAPAATPAAPGPSGVQLADMMGRLTARRAAAAADPACPGSGKLRATPAELPPAANLESESDDESDDDHDDDDESDEGDQGGQGDEGEPGEPGAAGAGPSGSPSWWTGGGEEAEEATEETEKAGAALRAAIDAGDLHRLRAEIERHAKHAPAGMLADARLVRDKLRDRLRKAERQRRRMREAAKAALARAHVRARREAAEALHAAMALQELVHAEGVDALRAALAASEASARVLHGHGAEAQVRAAQARLKRLEEEEAAAAAEEAAAAAQHADAARRYMQVRALTLTLNLTLTLFPALTLTLTLPTNH